MKSKIHYSDNLYFITELIKTLQHGLNLTIDENFFLEKIIEDIFFIDHFLSNSFLSLKDNEHLLKRNDHLRTLLRSKKEYVKLIDQLMSGSLHLSEAIKPYHNRLHEAKVQHEKEIIEVKYLITGHKHEIEEDLVSLQEFEMLMKPDDEG